MPTATRAEVKYLATTVTFDDGRRLVFIVNHGRFGEPECNEQIKLEAADGTVLVCFNSSLQYPVNRRPFGFTECRLTEPDALGTLLGYWDEAAAYTLRVHTEARHVINKSWSDFNSIRRGSYPLPV